MVKLVKLLSLPLYKVRLNEDTAMCFKRALFKKVLPLVLNLKRNRYKSTDEVLWQESKYFFLSQSTPAMQLVSNL